MRDGYGRDIYYLRLSVTDLCNLRCVYCMPAQGVEKRRHEDILSIEELEEIALAAGRCGIRKIRLTGGEPLVRRGIVDICARTAAAPGVEEVCMTTNGLLLPGLAADLRRAGLRRVNISLDTLSPERYRQDAHRRAGSRSRGPARRAGQLRDGEDKRRPHRRRG